MNDILKCSSCAFFVALLQICLALTTFSCDSDSATEEDSSEEDEECTEIGETESVFFEPMRAGLICIEQGLDLPDHLFVYGGDDRLRKTVEDDHCIHAPVFPGTIRYPLGETPVH